MATNYKPAIRGTDHGIWRRIRMIPFAQQFVGNAADPNLVQTLRGESSGILAWAVRGCLEWRERGLGKPDAVEEATKAYRLEEDVLGQFLADCTTAGEGLSVRAAELYSAYKMWCEVNGEKPMTGTAFGRRVVDRGIHRVKGRQANRYEGIALAKGEEEA